MKKTLVICIVMAVLFLSACGSGPAAQEAPAQPSAPESLPEAEETASVEHDLVLSEGEDRYLDNKKFTQDVTISGDNSVITFEGCEFPGDVMLASEVGTRVVLINCTVAGSCVIDTGIRKDRWILPCPSS